MTYLSYMCSAPDCNEMVDFDGAMNNFDDEMWGECSNGHTNLCEFTFRVVG